MHLKPIYPPLLCLLLIELGCVEPDPGASTEAEPSSSTATPDPSTSGTETDAVTSTGMASSTGMDPDTGATDTGCDSGCPGDETDEVCPRDLAASSGLFALGVRHTWTATGECGDACTTPRSIVYSIDPVSADLTELAVGEMGTVPSAFAIAGDGSFVVVGELAPLEFEPGQASIERLAPTGETLWSVVLASGQVSDVALRGDEVVTVTSGQLAAYSLADGSSLWEVTDPDPALQRLALDAMGNVYAAGVSGDQQIVRKLDPTQALLWEVVDPEVEGTDVQLTAIAVDETGGVITAIRSWSNDGDDSVVLRKLDAEGMEAWSHTLDEGGPAPGKADDYVLDLVAHPAGSVAVGQVAIDGGVASARGFDLDGNELWSETYAHPKTPNARFVAAALDAGQVLALGCAQQPEPPYEAYRWMSAYAP